MRMSSKLPAPLQLDLYGADHETRVGHVRSYAHAIDVAIVDAYAEALAGAENYYSTNSCWAWADASGCIYPDGPCASCTASAVSDTYIEEIDAIATAGVPPFTTPPSHWGASDTGYCHMPLVTVSPVSYRSLPFMCDAVFCNGS